MAVVERKRSKGVVYSVTNEWQGKPAWERVGTSRREAETRDRAMKKEIKNGTYVPNERSRSSTVMQIAGIWASTRTNAYADEERAILDRYLADSWLANMLVADVKQKHIVQWVEELKAEMVDGQRRITDKTIANAVGVLRMVFKYAALKELCATQPVVLPKTMLRRKSKNEKEIYSLAECVVLMRHHTIPWPQRVINALLLLTGMRLGEVAGRRWRDLEDGPVAALIVRDQYDSQPLKTERERIVPVHPELHRVLTQWAIEGFELYTGVRPTPGDFIVPNMSRWAQARHHTESSLNKQFCKTAEAAGVRPRTVHSTRHTFITLCRRFGARPDVLERVTHNSCDKMIDRYTHMEWAPLCEAVLCLNLDAHQDSQTPQMTVGQNPGSFLANIAVSHPSLPLSSMEAAGIEDASDPKKLPVFKGSRKTRQGVRQELSGSFEEGLRTDNRTRKRRLLTLEELDPEAAKPGLAICRALDAVYDGDLDEATKQLTLAGEAVA